MKKTLTENAYGWMHDALRYVGWRREWREAKAKALLERANGL